MSLLRSPFREKISGKYENTINWIGNKYRPILSIAVLAFVVNNRINKSIDIIADHHQSNSKDLLNSNLGKKNNSKDAGNISIKILINAPEDW